MSFATLKNFPVAATVIMLAAAPPVLAQAPTLEQRIERLERAVNSETLIELLRQVEHLEQEVQALRGELEVQTHELSQVKQRQRELYHDIERRMTRLETVRPAVAADSGGGGDADGGGSPTQPVADSSTISVDHESVEERAAYQSAFNLLKAGRYEDAAARFKEFLASHPSGEYADNAQYWLGEAYYVTRAFEAALSEFRKLVQTWPDSAKISHALLKMGYIHDELGQKEAAIATLNELLQRFPNTTAGGLATERLREIQ